MNWLTLTKDDLETVAPNAIIDAAQTLVAPGQSDPVARAIADATLSVRDAVSAGNALDTDPATVPGSLRALAARLATFALLERLEVSLTPNQQNTRAADLTRLTRIREERQRFEPADHPGPAPAGVETVAHGNTGNSRAELRGI